MFRCGVIRFRYHCRVGQSPRVPGPPWSSVQAIIFRSAALFTRYPLVGTKRYSARTVGNVFVEALLNKSWPFFSPVTDQIDHLAGLGSCMSFIWRRSW